MTFKTHCLNLGAYVFRFRESTCKHPILLVAATILVHLLLLDFSASAWNDLSSLSTITLYVSYSMPILFASLQRRNTGWSDVQLAVTEVIAVV